MENLKTNQPFQNLIVDYQIKLIDKIDFWLTKIETQSSFERGMVIGLKTARQLFIETIKEMETKYNETL